MNGVALSMLERVPEHRFRYDNNVRYMGLPCLIWFDTPRAVWAVDNRCMLLGWNDLIGNQLMRPGQIAVLLHHQSEGEVWEHVPIFPEDRDGALFMLAEVR